MFVKSSYYTFQLLEEDCWRRWAKYLYISQLRQSMGECSHFYLNRKHLKLFALQMTILSWRSPKGQVRQVGLWYVNKSIILVLGISALSRRLITCQFICLYNAITSQFAIVRWLKIELTNKHMINYLDKYSHVISVKYSFVCKDRRVEVISRTFEINSLR